MQYKEDSIHQRHFKYKLGKKNYILKMQTRLLRLIEDINKVKLEVVGTPGYRESCHGCFGSYREFSSSRDYKKKR